MKRLLFIAFLASSTLVLAQDFEKEKLDQLLDLIEEKQKGMGSLSIFQDGTEVYQKAIGFVDVDQGIKADASTIYRIGSISKTFTAVMIMQLIEEDKLALATNLSDFFPKIPNAEKITIEHLLRHQSGVFSFTSLPDYTKWMERPMKKEELLAKITEQSSLFEPGSKSEYSNSNYMLLTLIIEQLDEGDFPEILERRITKKLGLDKTYYGGSIRTDQNEAQSYWMKNKWKKSTETDMSIPMGAGALVSTPTDLNTFFHGLFSGELVSDASLELMTELKMNFGLGLFQVPFYEKRAFGHTGGIDGFQSNAFYFPEEKVSIAYTSNGVVMTVNDIMLGALSIYFGKRYELPEFKPPLKVSSKQLDAYLGVYSGANFPLKITITKEGSTLMAQATGQSSFALEAYEEHKFKFDRAMLKLEFIPDESVMILRQGGGEFRLTKEGE